MIEEAYRVERFGLEREPVIIIDDFSQALAELVRTGRAAQYSRVQGNAYPGIRAQIEPKNYVGRSKRSPDLARSLRKTFGFAGNLRFESCAFSIVTLRPDELSYDQRLPHFDDSNDNVIALVHYLDAPEDSGTAFYRHRRTVFETISADRFEEYKRSQKLDDCEYSDPEAAYQSGNSQRYECIGEIAAKPDRLIAYRGRRLHSGNISDPRIDQDPQAFGRLTITGFVVAQQ